MIVIVATIIPHTTYHGRSVRRGQSVEVRGWWLMMMIVVVSC
jgi:hypothetical protein